VGHYYNEGYSPEGLLDAFPTLTLPLVRKTIVCGAQPALLCLRTYRDLGLKPQPLFERRESMRFIVAVAACLLFTSSAFSQVRFGYSPDQYEPRSGPRYEPFRPLPPVRPLWNPPRTFESPHYGIGYHRTP
jgi:hypothetical protein